MQRRTSASSRRSAKKGMVRAGLVLVAALAFAGAQQAGATAAVHQTIYLGLETAPGAPTGLVATTASATSVALSWTAPIDNGGADITSYAVEYKLPSDGSWTVESVSAPATTDTVTGLTKGSHYLFRVAAVNSIGLGPYSQNGLTFKAFEFPFESENPARTEVGRTACLTAPIQTVDFDWMEDAPSVNSDSGTCPTDYFLVHITGEITWPGTYDGTSTRTVTMYGSNDDGFYMTIGGSPVFTDWGTHAASEYDEQVSVTRLAGANYPIDMWMYDASGGAVLKLFWNASGSTAIVPAEAFQATSQVPSEEPGAPSAVTATPTFPSSLAVSWDAPTDNGGQDVIGYLLQYSSDDGVNWSSNIAATGSPKRISGLTPGSTYKVRVRAVNPVGAGASAENSTGVPLVTPPGSPTGFATSAFTGDTVSLSWHAPTDNGGSALTGYTVDYRATTTDSWTTGPTVGADTTSTTITGLVQGTQYVFRVHATNAIGDSSPAGRLNDRYSAAANVSCAVMPTGTVSCWGANWAGQLGDGTTNASSSPVQVVGISNAVSVAAGDDHACALIADGTVMCWGSNDIGQLGDGTMDYRATPSTVSGVTNAIAIASGDSHSCAVLSDGTMKCWGRNWDGQLGDGTTTNTGTPVAVSGMAGAASVTASSDHTCAALYSGEVSCWGGNWDGQLGDGTQTSSHVPVSVVGISTAVSLSANSGHSCAVLADGHLACWGSNGSGQLGDGTTNRKTTPVTVVGISTAVAVTTGDDHACAVLADGTMRCWGANWDGQLGDDSTNDSTTIVTVKDVSDVVFAASGNHFTCAVLKDGAFRCWGNNGDGQLGDGTTDGKLTSVKVPGFFAPSLVSAIPSVAPGVTGVPAAVPAYPSSVIATWDAPADNGGQPVSGYVLQYSDDDGANWSSDIAATGSPKRIAGLTPGSTYKVRVKAINPVGVGPWTESTSGVLLVTPPGPPTAFAVTSYGASSVALSWAAPADTGGTAITGYTLQYRATDAADWVNAPAISGGATSATVSSLTQGTVYVFRLRASNAQGDGAFAGNLDDRISAAEGQSCAVTAAGTVNCWGSNGDGQLGNGTTTRSTTPVQVIGVTHAVAVAGGSSQQCALITDGTVRCWGDNWAGQLGDGTYTSRSTPVTVSGITTAVAITAGDGHSCALLADGTVRCWGGNWNGQLGDGTWDWYNTPVSVTGLSGAVDIAAGADYTCAVLASGSVKCWGSNGTGQLGNGSKNNSTSPVAVQNMTDATSISARGDHTCVVMLNGTVECWGSNGNGKLGDGTTASRIRPAEVAGLSNAISVAVGSDHTCAVLADGTMKCWGYGGEGQLGAGSTSDSRTPQTVTDLAGAVGSSAGWGHTCAVLADGTVRCWGNNYNGRLGDGTTTRRTTSVAVTGLVAPAYVAAIPSVAPGAPGTPTAVPTFSASLAVSWAAPGENGGQPITGYAVQYSSDNGVNWLPVTPLAVSGTSTKLAGLTVGSTYKVRVTAVSLAGVGSAAVSSPTLLVTPPGPPTGVSVASVAGTAVTLAWSAPADNGGSALTGYTVQYRTSDAASWSSAPAAGPSATGATVGGLTRGTLYVFRVRANNAVGSSTYNVPVSGKLVAGGAHSCAVQPDGTVKCWGYNGSGRLGDGTTTNRTSPTAVTGITSAVAVTAGDSHSCALLADGTAKCWGYNGDGQLGNNTRTNASSPVVVSGLTGASAIDAGYNQTCAVVSGVVKCWGANSDAQLGDGTYTRRLTPVTVTGITTAVSVSAGSYSSCAVLANGAVRCWGWNSYGKLGDGTTSYRAESVAVAGVSTAISVGVAYEHACALLSDGTVKCWGFNGDGQLGDGTTTASLAPVEVHDIATAVELSVGEYHSCAVLADGTVKCWGYNGWYQLGDNSYTNRSTPVEVSGVTTAVSVSAGTDHTCATLSDETVQCWGRGGSGRLGDGSTTDRATPVTAAGASAQSLVSGVPSGADTAPDAPTSVTATAGAGSADVSWTAPGNDGGQAITGYTVTSTPGSLTCTTATTGCTVSGLTNGTAYTFTVVATNSVGDSAASAASSSVTPASAPGAPTGVSGVAGAGSVEVSWTAPTSDGGSAITGYTVTSTPGSFTCTAATSPCTVSGLTQGTSYTFTVKATNAIGDSPASDASSGVTPLGVPGAPTGVSGVSGAGSVAVSWTAPTSDGGSAITGYTVTSAPGSFTCTATASPCTVTGLTNGTSYTFTVVATNAIGNSVPSAPSTGVVPATVPDAPRNLAATHPSGTSVALSWTAPLTNGGAAVTDYLVQYRLAGDLSWTLFSDGVSTTRSATVTGLVNGSTYDFRVAALNSMGSTYTAPISTAAASAPGPVSGVAASAASITSLSVAWTAPAVTGGVAVTDYAVAYSTNNGSSWTAYADGVSTATSATISGLSTGASYLVRVAAINPIGQGAWTSSSAVLLSVNLTPTFGVVARNATGFTVQVTNYAAAYTWTVAVTSGSGTAKIGNTGLITVSGVTAGPTTLSVTTSVSGTTTGTASVSGSATPVVSSFTPTSASRGAAITVTGTNVWGATSVTVGGVAVPRFTVVNATTIVFGLPAGAVTGRIVVATPVGSATSATNLTVSSGQSPANLTGSKALSVTSGGPGTSVLLTGAHLGATTAVTLGGTVATFNVISDTTVMVSVPVGGKTGAWAVTTAAGTASSANFTFVATATAPAITSRATSATAGTFVTLGGTNVGSATRITVNGVATSYAVESAKSVVVYIPANAAKGVATIVLTTPGGSATSTVVTVT